MDILLEKNLQNLHEYWLALGALKQDGAFLHQRWPYKHWRQDYKLFEPAHESSNNSLVTAEQIETVPNEWNKKGQLVIMSLAAIGESAESEYDTEACVWIEDKDSLNSWVESCSQAFGYQLDLVAINNLYNQTNAYILAHFTGGKISGTAIGFKTDSTFGIHQFGVVPDFRGLGIAKKLMQSLLLKANYLGCSNVSLQASQAGLPLYKSYGFEELGYLTSFTRVE